MRGLVSSGVRRPPVLLVQRRAMRGGKLQYGWVSHKVPYKKCSDSVKVRHKKCSKSPKVPYKKCKNMS